MEPYQKEAFLAALRQNGSCEITVYGSSMWPAIRNGERIHVTLPDPKPHIGQIVGVFADNQLIVHRILFHRSIEGGNRVWIRGDALPYSLARVNYDKIVCEAPRISGFLTGLIFFLTGLFVGYPLFLMRKILAKMRN